MNIANIINFVRAVEPREKDDSYLLPTIREELKLCNRYGFRNTVLLQYDALVRKEYIDVLNEHGQNSEIGLWFEVVEPLCIDAGLVWRGRYPWDWRNDVGFLIGYTPKEREKLIDAAFEGFRRVFGYYPVVVGSWHIDAYSLNYMKEKYDIIASCNCKDQYGTDGYTIWGGYYSGAYYPAKTNMLCPAQSTENKIDVPVFRMLGSDPIHQYDLGLGKIDKAQSVMSLEPVYDNSGADREWVEWYLRENFNGKNLSLSYTQFGQENSFGWDEIEKGLSMQFEILDRKIKSGEIELLTLGEAGRKFRECYKTNPPTAMCIDSDHKETDYKTMWYHSSRYRVNTLYRDGIIHIRDIQIFDNTFRERYLHRKTQNNECFFSNVPFVDGFRFSSERLTAGAYFHDKNNALDFDGEYKTVAEKDSIVLTIGTEFKLKASPDELKIHIKKRGWKLVFIYEKFPRTEFTIINSKKLRIDYYGHKTYVNLNKGNFVSDIAGFNIIPERGVISIAF